MITVADVFYRDNLPDEVSCSDCHVLVSDSPEIGLQVWTL
jgi:hypothetical protein